MSKQQFKFPKLPDQDDYLLDLQNNNYSKRTINNYARDLCIFAMFLKTHSTKFEDLDKKNITVYKGYLKNGDHIRDLNDFRESVAENAGITTDKGARPSKGSNKAEKDQGGTVTPSETDVNYENSRDSAKKYLEDVYRKVYGSLGRLKTGSTRSRGSDGLEPRSINRMLSALRSYLKYRIDFDLNTPLAPDAVKLIKAPRKKKQVAELDQLIELIESPSQFEKDERVSARNRAMLEMLFSTGMRISELIGLDLEQINLEGKIFIEGKGRKQRFVYLTPRAMGWLDRYLNIRLRYVGIDDDPEQFDGKMPGQKLLSVGVEKGLDVDDISSFEQEDDSDDADRETGRDVSRGGGEQGEENTGGRNSDGSSPFKFSGDDFPHIDLLVTHQRSGFLKKFHSPALFIPFSGGRNGSRSKRLSTNHLQGKIADYRRRLGIQVPTSAHSLRHGFATYLAENGASPAAIQVLLGHESLSTTTKYVHASDRFAEKTHREKHPLE